MFIIRLVQALRAHKVNFAIAGGHAVALHGAVRGTFDIDLVLAHTEKNFIAAEKALSNLGLSSRLPVNALEVFKFRKEYLENRNLIAWSFVNNNNPIELVDILLGCDMNDVKKAEVLISGNRVPLVALDDLIKMKKQAGRPQDLEDIRALRALAKK